MDLLNNIDNPRQLEKLYRDNKTAFKTEFNLLYPQLSNHQLAAYWKERLSYEGSEISWGSSKELIFVMVATILAGLLAKFPSFFHLDQETFYQRNIGFIVFPALTAYFIWKQNLPIMKIAIAGVIFSIAAIFINLLPVSTKSDTLILSCIHLQFLLWSVLGFIYMGGELRGYIARVDFLKYNGDLIIMTGLFAIAGIMLTAVTIGLFSVIGLRIEEFYFNNVVVFGLPALPILATHITRTNPQLVNKVSPVIAKIFSPLVLIMLVVYLIAISFSGKDPYNDRDFLVVFNVLLVGVMAIILFSVAETAKHSSNVASNIILLALSIVTVVVNGIALSAILFRISEWGITPNRLAVMGANVLMLTNLLVVTFRLFQTAFKKADINGVASSISMFLPIYTLWTIVVVFIFPLIFQFK